jgi:hypothetical protein
MAGPVIATAAELEPSLFNRLVFVSAFLPRSGESLASLAAEDKHSDLPGAARVSLIKGVVTIRPERLQPVYYNDCNEADLAWVRARLVSESVRPSLGKAQLTTERFQSVPRSYIRCTMDRALSVQMQDRMIERQPCTHIASLSASHSSFLSMPDAFATALLSVI